MTTPPSPAPLPSPPETSAHWPDRRPSLRFKVLNDSLEVLQSFATGDDARAFARCLLRTTLSTDWLGVLDSHAGEGEAKLMKLTAFGLPEVVG